MSEFYSEHDQPFELPVALQGLRDVVPEAIEIVRRQPDDQAADEYAETPIVAGEGRRRPATAVVAETAVVSPPFGVQRFDREAARESERAYTTTLQQESIRDAFDRHPDFKDLVVAGGETTASMSLEHRSSEGVAYLRAFSNGMVTARFVGRDGGQTYHEYVPDEHRGILRDDIDLARLVAGLPQPGEVSTATLWEIQHDRHVAESFNLAEARRQGIGGRPVGSAEAAYIAGLMRQAEPEIVPLRELDRLSSARIGSSGLASPDEEAATQAANEFEVMIWRFLDSLKFDPRQAEPVRIDTNIIDPRGGFMLIRAGQEWDATGSKTPFVQVRFDQDLDAGGIGRLFGGRQFTDVSYAKSRVDLAYGVTGGMLTTTRAGVLTDEAGTILHAEQGKTARGDTLEVRRLRGFLRRPVIWHP